MRVGENGCWARSPLRVSRRVIGGVAAATVQVAAARFHMLMEADCPAVLLNSPFHFKGVTDDGLFAWSARVFNTLGSQARSVLLYSIPSVTAVPLSVELVGRFCAAFPGVIPGIEDSGGDFAYTECLLATHRDTVILIEDERGLAAGVRRGSQGAIRELVPRLNAGRLIRVAPQRGMQVARAPDHHRRTRHCHHRRYLRTCSPPIS